MAETDNRIPLQEGEILDFEGMPCHIDKVIGKGGNAIVYQGWYEDSLKYQPSDKTPPVQDWCGELLGESIRHQVLIKELFPYHEENLVYRKKGSQEIIAEDQDFFANQRLSFEAGNHIHMKLLDKQPGLFGKNINSFKKNNTLYTILGYDGGRSLEEELSQNGRDTPLRTHVLRMQYVLRAVEAFHESKYLHLDISPENIMLLGKDQWERCILIDYNNAKPVDSTSQFKGYREEYSAPEVLSGDSASQCFASDLYSVGAVFYRCITGSALQGGESLMGLKVDSFISDQPSTVVYAVNRLLTKSLNASRFRRFQSTEKMSAAFQDILDRIDGLGVTHWSLWENGRKGIRQLVKTNPSLRFIHENALYPIRLSSEDETLTLEEYLPRLLSSQGRSAIVEGKGGMGKTTLLLYSSFLQNKKYSPHNPAMFYISLRGWDERQPNYILHQILLKLRFKSGQNRMEDALHTLQGIFSHTVKYKGEEYPAALLLLDGLNEVQGNPEHLTEEIRQLQSMAGLRLLLTSRTHPAGLELDVLNLSPLHNKDIEDILGREHLLIPQNQEIFDLLRTPLILSIYVQASQGDSQLNIHSENELMDEYIKHLYKKAIRSHPEQSPRKWQLRAALHYVLPIITVKKKPGAINEGELLEIVESCWKVIHSKSVNQVFPEWIGHKQDIIGEAQNPEQWYNLIIDTLLWQELGLLIHSPEGGYIVFHQKIEEYLTIGGKVLAKHLHKNKRGQRLRWTGAALASSLLMMAFVVPKGYDLEQTEMTLDHVASCYMAYGYETTEIQKIAGYLEEGRFSDFAFWKEHQMDTMSVDIVFENIDSYLKDIDALCQSGDRVVWSKLPYDGEGGREFLEEMSRQLDIYEEYEGLLIQWADSERAREHHPEFPGQVQALMDVDLKIMSKQYYQNLVPHLENAPDPWKTGIEKLVAPVPGAEAEPVENLESLRNQREKILGELARVGQQLKLAFGE